MGKEVKISLAALALLLVVFCVVLARRLMGGSQAAAAPPAAVADDSQAAERLEPAPMQPTLLETSPTAGRPPLSQMTSPDPDAGSSWEKSRPSAAEEVVPGASFMPKPEILEADAEPRFAARPRTFASTDSRYDAEPPATTEGIEPADAVEPAPESAVEISDAGPILPVSDGEPLAQDAAAPREFAPPMNQVAVVASEAEPTAVISDSSPDAYAPAGAALPVAPSTVPDAPAMPSAGEPTPPASLGAQAIVPDAPASQAPTPVSAQPYRQPYQPSAPPAQTGYAAGDYAAEEAPAEPTPAASPPAYGYAPGTAAPQVSAPQVSPSVPAAQYEPNWAGGYDRSVSPPAARAEEVVERRQNTGVYYVEPGDSFWKISQKLYGTGGYFKALQAHNRDRFPNPADLDIGDEIATPTADELRAKYSGLCPKQRTAQPGTPQVRAVSTLAARPSRPYVVEEGDTLYDIAKYELGDARRWPEIFQLNRDALSVDIDYLRPGTKILLPVEADQPADMLTRQPGETLRR